MNEKETIPWQKLNKPIHFTVASLTTGRKKLVWLKFKKK